MYYHVILTTHRTCMPGTRVLSACIVHVASCLAQQMKDRVPERRIMSILNYFRQQTPQERGVFVLPTVSTTGVSGEEIAACNNEVEAVIRREDNKRICIILIRAISEQI